MEHANNSLLQQNTFDTLQNEYTQNEISRILRDYKAPDEVVILQNRPVNFTRRLRFLQSPGKIPIIKETTVIETEPSFSRVAGMFVSILLYAAIVLIVTHIWKRVHPKTFTIVTNVILCILPILISLRTGEYVFAFITLLFFVKSGMLYVNVSKRPIRTDTPKKVYTFFITAYRVSYIVSYCFIGILLVSYTLKADKYVLISLYLAFYGVYFGLIIRESIEIIGEKMACNIGYYSKDGLAKKNANYETCSLCDNGGDSLVMLPCKHQYHQKCIKGWLLMGKKSICPCCREKVDLERLNLNFLDKNDTFYGGMIDHLRSFVLVIFSLYVLAKIK